MKPDQFAAIIAGLQLELPPTEIARRLKISKGHYYRLRGGEIGRLSHDVVARAEVLVRSLGTTRKG
jgi:hypothetical protein